MPINTGFIVSSSRNPFEIFLLVACVLGGIGGLIDPERGSQAIIEALPLWQRHTWHLALALGGAISLIGALGRKLIFMHVERMGLTLLTGFGCGYAIALFSQITRPLALPALTIVFFALSCLVRVLQINRDLKIQKTAYKP